MPLVVPGPARYASRPERPKVKRPTIIEVAAFAGIAAFLWTIVSSKPPREPRAGRSRLAGGTVGMPPRDPPTDIPGLILRVRNDPGDHGALMALARRYEMYGQPEHAAEAWNQLVAATQTLTPESPRFGRGVFARAAALRAQGRTDEATTVFAAAADWYTRRLADNASFGGNRQLMMRLGWARRLSGDEAGAREAWKAALQTVWGDADGPDGQAAYDKAALLCLLDRSEEGLTALTVAAERGYDDPEGALADEAFSELRDDERFQRTVERFRRNDVSRRWNDLFGSRTGTHGAYRVGGARQL
jgi:hypothetical protein